MMKYDRIWCCFALLLSLCLPLPAMATPPAEGMVVAADSRAVDAGAAMLAEGGNAFDAAAATALALGVVEPGSSGLGGGGFFLLYIAKEDRYVMLDARETSPKLAGHGELFRLRSSMDGAQSAGVPGLAAGVDHLLGRYGRLSRSRVVRPALRLARKGFDVSPRLQRMLAWRKGAMNDAERRVFLTSKHVVQPALAETLQRFARGGADDFYRGATAGRLVADMKRDGGLIREADLADYRVIERQPQVIDFQGYRIVAASLPSSGGITLAEIFGMLKHDHLQELSALDRAHLLIETMKRAYRDRNHYLGDPGFIAIPDLLDAKRLAAMRATIDMARATPSRELGLWSDSSGAGQDTTHFSVVDREGNMVSATLSINYPFGAAYLSPATGLVMNDEMDDFATRPGQPNAYGLVQGRANAVAPGKRMLSSMTPSFVIGPERTLIVGTPGGSRIISMVLLATVGFMAGDIEQGVNGGRFHHQFQPDLVQYEQGAFTPDVAKGLRQRGHVLKKVRTYGNMEAIVWQRQSGRLKAVVDHRGEGFGRTVR